LVAFIVYTTCTKAIKNIYLKNCVWYVINLLHGEKNGKKIGMK